MKKVKCNVSKCKAVCCGVVPFDIKILKKHMSKMNKTASVDIGPYVAYCYDRETLKCGFLDEDDYKCKIYEDRPVLCKIFGDPKQVDILLKCQHLGQIGTMEQEQALSDSIDRIKRKVNNG